MYIHSLLKDFKDGTKSCWGKDKIAVILQHQHSGDGRGKTKVWVCHEVSFKGWFGLSHQSHWLRSFRQPHCFHFLCVINHVLFCWDDGECLTQFFITHNSIQDNRFSFLFSFVYSFHQIAQFRFAFGTCAWTISFVRTFFHFKWNVVGICNTFS